MAHFAKLDENNKVLNVEVVADSDCLDENGNESEAVGIAFLTSVHGWTNWKKTSYNTHGGKHYDAEGNESSDQSKALRANHACPGMVYDSTHDIFRSEKVDYDSWVLNTTTGLWEAPIAYPSVTTYTDSENNVVPYQNIYWYETNQTWRALQQSGDTQEYQWNNATSVWSAV